MKTDGEVGISDVLIVEGPLCGKSSVMAVQLNPTKRVVTLRVNLIPMLNRREQVPSSSVEQKRCA